MLAVGADEVIVARRRQQQSSGGAGVVVAAAVVAVVVAPVRQWLTVWWPLLLLGVGVVAVLALWRLLVLRRRWRARAVRQAELDRQVASTDGMPGPVFEQLVARLLRRDGWAQVVVSGGAGDLGADVTARHPRDGSLLVVQCKRYTDRAVSSPDLQRFLGTVFHHHRADHAVYVTTSSYSRPALALAQSNGVLALDRQGLAEWMSGAPLPLTARVATR